MKTILLTGSEGYIGQNFIYHHSDQFNIIPIDRKIGKEVLDFNDFESVDYIIHLAAISGIANCELDKEQTIYDNVTSTLYLMKKSTEYNIPMVFASSQGAKTADNLYSITKRICEIEAMSYGNHIKILRFANVYGGINYLESKTSVVAKFLNATLNKRQLIINGDGNQIRDFIHVDDILKSIYFSLESNIPHPIDVGTGMGTSINKLADMISNNVRHNKISTIGIESNVANTDDIKKYLVFKPKYSKLEKYINSCL